MDSTQRYEDAPAQGAAAGRTPALANGTASADPAGAGYPSPVRAWWGVAVLSLLYALSLLDRQIIALLVNDIRADLGISDFQIGLVSGLAFAVFYVTFGIFFGWLADRYPRRAVIFVGVLIWSISATACGLARNFFQLAAARFGLGAGEAALNPAAYSLISDSFPRERLSLALSVFGTGAHIGTALSILLGGVVIALIPAAGMAIPFFGTLPPWRLVFIFVGLPGLLFAWIIWTIGDPPRRQRLSDKRSGIGDAFRFMKGNRRLFTGHFLGFGLLVSASYSWSAWVPVYLIRRFELPIGDVVTILSVIAFVAGIGGTVIAGLIADRAFARRTDIHVLMGAILCAGQLVFVVAAIASNSIPLFIAGAFGFVLMSAYGGLGVAALQLVTPNEYRGQLSACYLFCFNLMGLGIGPTLTGAITTFVFADDRMVGWAIVTTCALLLPIGAIALLSARAPMRRAVVAAQAWSG